MSEDDNVVELKIQAKRLTAPRITPDMLESAIKSEEYLYSSTGTLTTCVLTLVNDFTVTGESACVSPENYDKDIGNDIARANAVNRLWPLLGFALAENLSNKKTVPMETYTDGTEV